MLPDSRARPHPRPGLRAGHIPGSRNVHYATLLNPDGTMKDEAALRARGYGPVTTEIKPAGAFYFAEDYHQQYLAKNPGGYCNHGFNGVACSLG